MHKYTLIGTPDFSKKIFISDLKVLNKENNLKVLLEFHSKTITDSYFLYDFHESFIYLYKLGSDIYINNEKHKITYIGIKDASTYKERKNKYIKGGTLPGLDLFNDFKDTTKLLHFEIMDY